MTVSPAMPKMEPFSGFEPEAFFLLRGCSTPELEGLNGAGDGTRTRDPQLGRLMLYQLSYTRKWPISRPSVPPVGGSEKNEDGGQKWI